MESAPTPPTHVWNIFIAYAKKDAPAALELYDALAKQNSKVFLDQKCLIPGSRWDQEIPKAQRAALVTIALISGNTEQAYYAVEEIRAAIDMFRDNSQLHRLVPVYLDEFPRDTTKIIYGLRLIQGISVTAAGGMMAVASQLTGAIPSQFAAPVAHPLLDYPAGPLVPLHMIERPIIDMYSILIDQSEALLVVSEANAFRQKANPGTKFIIQPNRVTGPDRIPRLQFWTEVFTYAGLQGPRMVMALLIVVPDDMFTLEAQQARARLMEALQYHR